MSAGTWIILGAIAYTAAVWLLIRFFQSVHDWDETIQKMEEKRKK